jgi:hypothetical protein
MLAMVAQQPPGAVQLEVVGALGVAETGADSALSPPALSVVTT